MKTKWWWAAKCSEFWEAFSNAPEITHSQHRHRIVICNILHGTKKIICIIRLQLRMPLRMCMWFDDFGRSFASALLFLSFFPAQPIWIYIHRTRIVYCIYTKDYNVHTSESIWSVLMRRWHTHTHTHTLRQTFVDVSVYVGLCIKKYIESQTGRDRVSVRDWERLCVRVRTIE